MNKKRFTAQKDFNDNWNGYFEYGNGNYITCVNREFIGLSKWDGKLFYIIG